MVQEYFILENGKTFQTGVKCTVLISVDTQRTKIINTTGAIYMLFLVVQLAGEQFLSLPAMLTLVFPEGSEEVRAEIKREIHFVHSLIIIHMEVKLFHSKSILLWFSFHCYES